MARPQKTGSRPDPATSRSNEAARKRMAVIVLAAVVALFVIQIVALILGRVEISFLILAVIVAGWFALRAYQKRHPL